MGSIGAEPRVKVILAVSGALLTAVVMATLVAVILLAGGDAVDDDGPVVTLLGANVADADPFTRSIVVAPVTISDQAATRTAGVVQQIPVRADRGVRPVSGRQPGLYGTTGQTLPCDVVTLANDLDVDRDGAHLWGLAQGLTTEQIPYYLNTLTPVVLMSDTWVTVHQRQDGASSAHQAVLQAGNAVLVDPAGVPRVRCVTGEPLTPPADVVLGHYRTQGRQWPGFRPQDVVAISYTGAEASGVTTELELVDVQSGQTVVRKVGGIIDLGGATVPLPDPARMNIPPPAAVGQR